MMPTTKTRMTCPFAYVGRVSYDAYSAFSLHICSHLLSHAFTISDVWFSRFRCARRRCHATINLTPPCAGTPGQPGVPLERNGTNTQTGPRANRVCPCCRCRRLHPKGLMDKSNRGGLPAPDRLPSLSSYPSSRRVSVPSKTAMSDGDVGDRGTRRRRQRRRR